MWFVIIEIRRKPNSTITAKGDRLLYKSRLAFYLFSGVHMLKLFDFDSMKDHLNLSINARC